MASGGGVQQQDQADLDKSEAIWLEYIRKNYPNLEQHTYFYPPLYFNRVRFAVDEVAGLPVIVTDPNHKRRAPLTQPSTLSASSGTPSSASSSTRQPPGIFIENPPGLRPPSVQESDQRDDQAQCECLSFLRRISPEEPMVVITQLEFQNYLNVITNPNDEGLPSDCQNGDWDVLIIHRHFGLIVGEVKAVDGSAEHTTPEAIQRRVEKALEQLKKQHKALVALVKNLTPPGGNSIRITRILMLPNLTYDQVNIALSSLQQELCQTLSNSDDPDQTRRHVLCRDDLPRATQWWRNLHGQDSDRCMTFNIYERLVARFCGQATTVRIPVACTLHRSVLRTEAEAVDETRLRYSFLTLTSTQVTLLWEMPDQRHVVYCQGPPGCGKSVVLLLKAVQWVQMEKKVVIISQPSGSAAVSMLIKHQLTEIVGKKAAEEYIRVHSIDFDDDHDLNVHDDVQRLWNDHGLDCAILCDEVPVRNANNFVPWLEEVHKTSPQNQLRMWMAGVWLRDLNVNALLRLPDWVEVCPMHDPLRCPLNITKAVQESRLMGQYIGPYNMSTRPMHTKGFSVKRLQHFGELGHCTEKDPLLCNKCTDAVAGILKSLEVGERGKPLQYRDVWLLTNGYQGSNEPPMVQRLREIHEMPVASIRGTTLGEANAEELALASTNQIIETHFHMVRGLERSVVVSVATRVQDYEFESISRSISYLICID